MANHKRKLHKEDTFLLMTLQRYANMKPPPTREQIQNASMLWNHLGLQPPIHFSLSRYSMASDTEKESVPSTPEVDSELEKKLAEFIGGENVPTSHP